MPQVPQAINNFQTLFFTAALLTNIAFTTLGTHGHRNVTGSQAMEKCHVHEDCERKGELLLLLMLQDCRVHPCINIVKVGNASS